MGKVVDGVELLRMIRDKEISGQTKIYFEKSTTPNYRFYIMSGIYIQFRLYREDVKGKEKDAEIRTLDTHDLIKNNFIIPEDEEIDIQSIEGLPLVDDLEACEPNEYNIQLLGKKYNELLKIVKQLDKKIKEKE